MRWIVDTSAWSRRGQQEVRDQLRAVVQAGDQLAFSPPALIEVLRGPQGADVAAQRAKLAGDIPVLAFSANGFDLAIDSMEVLAEHSPEGHRVPVADLLTAVIAHEHGAGVLHCDGHFKLLSEHAGLAFPETSLKFETGGVPFHPAARQRELRNEIKQELHRLPFDQAEKLLQEWLAQVRSESP